MNIKPDIATWSESPMVTAPTSALLRSSLPIECQDFLLKKGLPSNALCFDPSSGAIMCFDCVAILRDLGESDVSVRTWKAITAMGRLIIIGVYSAAFVVIDSAGSVFLIQTDTTHSTGSDAGWTPITFVNKQPKLFVDCLVEYKKLVDVFKTEAYDFASTTMREAFLKFKNSVAKLDSDALKENSYWFQIIDHLDVW